MNAENMDALDKEHVRQKIRERYGQIAQSTDAGCGCSPSCCSPLIDIDLPASTPLGYSSQELDQVPEGADMGLGCGNPQLIASLQAGETILDLGSGGGLDCFLASRQVGLQGRVIGVDMTPEMIDRARQNARQGGYTNVEFRLGEIENLPVPDNVVDVIISNCVINLSPDKGRVYREAYRVLKPGGRLAISDVVAIRELSPEIRADFAKYAGCVAGAPQVEQILAYLEEAGFTDIHIDLKPESQELIKDWFPGMGIETYVISAAIRASK